MSISWDENQMPSIIDHIEHSLELANGGELAVISMEDIPENCFAGQVYLEEKEFQVYTNLENPATDTTVNIVLGYIVAMAFDKVDWAATMDIGTLFDCHRQVCTILLDFNEDFCKHIEECTDILEAWHQNLMDPNKPATLVVSERESDDLVEEMGMELFGSKPKGKEYVN